MAVLICGDNGSTGQEVLTQINSNTDDIVEDKADISALQSPTETIYQDVTGNEPSYVAGQLYYADNKFKLQDGFSDVIINIGEDIYRRVINNTGATIVKGKPVRHNGVTVGKVKVVLAKADTFENATILGMTAHDIPDGAEGIIFKMGDIIGMDTAGFTVGKPIYLSDTVAGEFTETRPIIVTQLGGVKVADAVNGVFTIEIHNNVPRPRILGSLLEATAPTSLPADLVNGTPITNYSESIEIVATVSTATGVITAPLDGIYRQNISLHCFFDNVTVEGKKEIYFDLVDVTDSVTTKSLRGFILKDAETYSMTDNGAVTLITGHEYRLEIRSELALTNFAFSASTFYLESILY